MSGSDELPPSNGDSKPPLQFPRPGIKHPLFPEPTQEEVQQHEELMKVVNDWRKSKDLPPLVDVISITEEMMKPPPGMSPGAFAIPIGPGSNLPSAFPGSPDRALLRPFRQPLFDSDFIVPGMRTN